MKIAGVTMTYNDGYKIKDWKSHYNLYREELDYYVIVDNGSEDEYISLLKETFPGEKIIERDNNGGCTAAYNDGIKDILKHTDADAIVIIGNDIRTSPNCLSRMYDYLQSNKDVGIISTAILHIDSDILDNFGHTISYFGTITECDHGKKISDISEKAKNTELVTGGFYMATREFYEHVGLQDEKLFMYSDEIDTALRAKKAGYKVAVLSEVFAWHWHINQPGQLSRKPASNYLVSRNRVYVARKHYGFFHATVIFLTYTFAVPFNLLCHGYKEKAKYSFLGGLNGLRGNMEMNKYTQF